TRTKIVTKESAVRYFGYAKQVGGSDHNSICKPQAKEDRVHQYLLEFLLDKDLLPLPVLHVTGTNVGTDAEGYAPPAPAISQPRLDPSLPTAQPVSPGRNTSSGGASAEIERARTDRTQAETTAQLVTHLIKQNESLTTQVLLPKKTPS